MLTYKLNKYSYTYKKCRIFVAMHVRVTFSNENYRGLQKS